MIDAENKIQYRPLVGIEARVCLAPEERWLAIGQGLDFTIDTIDFTPRKVAFTGTNFRYGGTSRINAVLNERSEWVAADVTDDLGEVGDWVAGAYDAYLEACYAAYTAARSAIEDVIDEVPGLAVLVPEEEEEA